MKIKVKKYEHVDKEIEVEFPYFFKENMSFANSRQSKTTLYGVMTKDAVFMINEFIDVENKEISYEVYKEKRSHGFDAFFNTTENKSTKEEFESVKQRALEFISKFCKSVNGFCDEN